MTSTLPPLVQAFSGAIGSASANALTYPLDLVTTRLQLDPPSTKDKNRTGIRGAIRILQSIIRRHGIGALYDGLWTDTGATLLSNFFYFYFYSFLRSLLTNRRFLPSSKPTNSKVKPHKPTMVEELVLGFIAGVASRAISTPLNIVTLKLQTERGNDEDDQDNDEKRATRETGLKAAVKGIYNEQGMSGFWRGFKTTTLLSLNPSLTLALFQLFRRLLAFSKRGPSAPQNLVGKTKETSTSNPSPNPKPGEAFIGAAVANSIAVTLLYPLILAKTRLQASSATSINEVLFAAYQGRAIGSSRGVGPGKKADGTEGKGGMVGLYQGLEMQIVKGFLSQGVTFLVKGRIEQMVVEAYLRRKRGV